MCWRDTFVEAPFAIVSFGRHLLRFFARWALRWTALALTSIGVAVLVELRSSPQAFGSTYVLPLCLLGGAAGLVAASISLRAE